LKHYDEKKCGGDCWEFLNSFLEIYFLQSDALEPKKYDQQKYKPRKCTDDDITAIQNSKGYLYICSPKTGLALMNYELIYPNRLFGFMIETKEHETGFDPNQVQVKRLQVDK
jgi:hypothetical protein